MSDSEDDFYSQLKRRRVHRKNNYDQDPESENGNVSNHEQVTNQNYQHDYSNHIQPHFKDNTVQMNDEELGL